MMTYSILVQGQKRTVGSSVNIGDQIFVYLHEPKKTFKNLDIG